MVRSQEQGEREAKRARGSGGFGGVPSGGQSYHNKGHPYRPAQMTRPAHCGTSASHSSYSAHSGQSSFSALPAQSSHHALSAQASTSSSSGYPEQQFRHRRGCFECRDFGHIKRDCPRFLSGAPQQSSRPMVPAPALTPPTQPARGWAQAARGRPRGGGRAGGGQARFFAIPARPDVVASDAVVTGIVLVFHRDASTLFDPGSNYSYVSSYFAHYLDMPRESFISSVRVSTPVGDTIVVDRIYRSFVVTIRGLETRVDILLLSMVDFDVILGMD
ncbi:uncharacterized protein [Nicotiana tomentosiformis]|uniref:uncharacterized protein n=1 Tax=Nicotiana tomentosiformis TaxID=4098 RepID=UPI00388C6841